MIYCQRLLRLAPCPTGGRRRSALLRIRLVPPQPRRNDAEDGHGGTYKIRAVASSPEPKRLICWRLDVKRRRARCAENSPATASRARYRSTLGGTARRRSGGGGASSP